MSTPTRRCWRMSGPIAVVVAATTLVGCGADQVSTRTVGTASNPNVFAVAQGQSTFPPATVASGSPVTAGSGPVLQVRSASTGRIVRDLATDVGDLSLSADGSTVYYESTAGHLDPFPIDRVSVAGGRPSQVAFGEDPAVSPTGADLAYATGDGQGIAVKTLAAHSTRRIDLADLIGPGASFNNTPGVVTWLSDTELLTVPPQDGTFFASPSTSAPPAQPGTCTAAYEHHQQCAIVINLDAARPASIVILDLPRDTAITAAGAGPSPGTLLVGSVGSVTRFAVTATSAVRQATMAVPNDGLVEGFSPDGHHVLYLRNHGPVQLWAGTITASGVLPASELLANADLGFASW